MNTPHAPGEMGPDATDELGASSSTCPTLTPALEEDGPTSPTPAKKRGRTSKVATDELGDAARNRRLAQRARRARPASPAQALPPAPAGNESKEARRKRMRKEQQQDRRAGQRRRPKATAAEAAEVAPTEEEAEVHLIPWESDSLGVWLA